MEFYTVIKQEEAEPGDIVIGSWPEKMVFLRQEIVSGKQAEQSSLKPYRVEAEKKTKKSRKWKLKEYRCEECEDIFKSDLHYLKVRCGCGSKKVISI